MKSSVLSGFLQNLHNIVGGFKSLVAVIVVARSHEPAQILHFVIPGVLGQMYLADILTAQVQLHRLAVAAAGGDLHIAVFTDDLHTVACRAILGAR